MPSYKLTYFNARGGAEVCRLVFAAAGKDYIDERIERDQWPSIKPGKIFFVNVLSVYFILVYYKWQVKI